jgi:high affinity Mn2+ porin
MLHKVIALSPERQESERSPLSTFGTLPARRLEFRVGKFAASDFFDANAAGSDTHLQFLNASLVQNAAYDFASDAAGYSWGTMTEFSSGELSVRFAELLMPGAPGNSRLLWNLRKGHSENFELQFVSKLVPRKPTVVRLLAFRNDGPMLSYSDRGTTASKYGFGLNVEQPISRGVWAFARLGWNNGAAQSFCYDEVDHTTAGGVVVRGDRWHRAFDRAGVGVASNGLSKTHAGYLAAGGTGLMLGGDGTLFYGREQVVEAFYTAHVKRGVYLSPSFQWITNPGMNRDRGNALIAGWRTHFEF